MRKKTLIALLLLVAALFSSCKAAIIEDILVAPALTEDQRAIVEAVNAVSSERVVYKYPVAGDWRAPIQFFDLDNDGVDEAIVFYSVQTEAVNAFLAVLDKDAGGNWTVRSRIEGAGTDVNTVTPIKLRGGQEKNLLVEWSSNRLEKRLYVYNYADGELHEGLNEDYSEILVSDLDGDGATEFLYVTAQKVGEPFLLKYADDLDGAFSTNTQIVLEMEMLSCIGLHFEKRANGQRLVYVDENLDGGVNATEVFEIVEDTLQRVDIGEDLDIFQLSKRQAETPAIVSRSFSGLGADILIPSETAPRETIFDETLWKYWYKAEDGALAHQFTSYANTSFNFILGIPDRPVELENPGETGETDERDETDDTPRPYEWLERAMIIESEEDQRLFQIIDAETRDVIFELKVIRIDDSIDNIARYEEQGFKSMQKSGGGAYRYFYRVVNAELCSPEDETFITENFYYGIVG